MTDTPYLKPNLQQLAKETYTWTDQLASTACEFGESLETDLHLFLEHCGQYGRTIWPDMIGVKNEGDRPLRDFLVQANDLVGKIFFDACRLCDLCERYMADGVEDTVLFEPESSRRARIAEEWEREELFGNMEGYRQPDTF